MFVHTECFVHQGYKWPIVIVWSPALSTTNSNCLFTLGVLFTRDFWLLLQKYGGYTTHSFRNLNNSFLNIHSPYTASTKVDAQTFWNITLTPLVRRLPLSEQQLDIKKWREILVGSFVTLLYLISTVVFNCSQYDLLFIVL